MSEIMLLSLLAGLATCLGGLVVVLFGKPNEKALAVFLGMAAGIMVAVVVFDLIPSSLTYGSIYTASIGFVLGAMLMYIMDLVFTIIYPQAQKTPSRPTYLLKMGYLIAMGIALHDLPEGIAIAVGYSATTKLGLVLALAIGMHNIPEGMATAAPLRMGGMAPAKILLINGAVSLFTPLGTWLGLLMVNISDRFISTLLALAAGAMTYLVKDELLPESHRRHPYFSKLGIGFGLSIILALTFWEH
ncbi:MAG: ZIP family metal transporter [Clostridia bacterium]|nr:ZIP family metal transporter [Clostridia bacterium]